MIHRAEGMTQQTRSRPNSTSASRPSKNAIRDHLFEKLNIHDTAGLTRYAIAAGIIESSVQLTIK